MKDNSYTPIENNFRQYVEMVYVPGRLSEEQFSMLRDTFFAGANTVRDIVQNHPTMTDLAFDELDDHGTARERRDPCG